MISLEKEHGVLIIFCLLVHLLVYLVLPGTEVNRYVDPDAYMRLVRCMDFLNNPDLRDHVIERSNAPEGETLHWSRPLDFILIGGSWPLRLFLGDRTGLSLFAYWISPLLQAFLLLIVLPVIARRLGRMNSFHFGLLLLCQPALLVSFMAGRPDHHSLLLLLFAATTAAVLTEWKGWPWLAGLACGLAAWVSIEALVTCLPFYACWTIRYILGKEDAARDAAFFTAAWLILALPAVWIETPAQIFNPSFTDRLSGMHLLALLMGGLVWLALFLLQRRCSLPPLHRLILITVGGGASLALLLFLFPQLIRGPYADVHPEMVKVWLSHVKEVEPLASSPDQWLTKTVTWLWPAYLAIPWLIISRKRWRPLLLRTPVLLGFLAALVFTPLAFYQIRWVTYAEFLWLFPCLFCLGDILTRIKDRINGPRQRILTIACILVFAGGYLPITIALLPSDSSHLNTTGDSNETSESENLSNQVRCEDLAAALVALSPVQPRTILARLGLGPELLYRTHHRVIATPYHRNHAGILFLREVMRNENMDEVQALLLKRGVHWILLEPDSPELSFYGCAEMPESFYQRLRANDLPAWVQKVSLPGNLSSRYHLYQVADSPAGTSD